MCTAGSVPDFQRLDYGRAAERPLAIALASVYGLAGSTGLEPAASAVTGLRSSQLNYDPNRTDADNADFKLQTSDWVADCVTSVCDLKSTI